MMNVDLHYITAVTTKLLETSDGKFVVVKLHDKSDSHVTLYLDREQAALFLNEMRDARQEILDYLA